MDNEIGIALVVMFGSLAIVGAVVAHGLWRIYSYVALTKRDRNLVAESKRSRLIAEARSRSGEIGRFRATAESHSRQD